MDVPSSLLVLSMCLAINLWAVKGDTGAFNQDPTQTQGGDPVISIAALGPASDMQGPITINNLEPGVTIARALEGMLEGVVVTSAPTVSRADLQNVAVAIVLRPAEMEDGEDGDSLQDPSQYPSSTARKRRSLHGGDFSGHNPNITLRDKVLAVKKNTEGATLWELPGVGEINMYPENTCPICGFAFLMGVFVPGLATDDNLCDNTFMILVYIECLVMQDPVLDLFRNPFSTEHVVLRRCESKRIPNSDPPEFCHNMKFDELLVVGGAAVWHRISPYALMHLNWMARVRLRFMDQMGMTPRCEDSSRPLQRNTWDLKAFAAGLPAATGDYGECVDLLNAAQGQLVCMIGSVTNGVTLTNTSLTREELTKLCALNVSNTHCSDGLGCALNAKMMDKIAGAIAQRCMDTAGESANPFKPFRSLHKFGAPLPGLLAEAMLRAALAVQDRAVLALIADAVAHAPRRCELEVVRGEIWANRAEFLGDCGMGGMGCMGSMDYMDTPTTSGSVDVAPTPSRVRREARQPLPACESAPAMTTTPRNVVVIYEQRENPDGVAVRTPMVVYSTPNPQTNEPQWTTIAVHPCPGCQGEQEEPSDPPLDLGSLQ